jgi:ribosomal protein S18 acetylase RimI-like enzyme
VAEVHGEIAAVITSMARADGGWIADLAVRPPWRRRGIGEALVRHVMDEFHSRGLTTVALNVDPLNETGATQLYERLGFRPDRRFDIYEKVL